MVVIDLRTYTLYPGKLKAWQEVYERLGKDIQWTILGTPVGFFTTEVGELHQLIHMWRYDSMADRETRRAAMAAHPGWGEYLAAATPLFLKMENKLITPLSLSPLK